MRSGRRGRRVPVAGARAGVGAVRLRALAPGKVNLSLILGEARADGRHELVTVFESISLADELELTTLEDGSGPDQVVCPAVPEPNLAAAALARLRATGWKAPPVRVEIRKRLPVAAGMAGGSSDAAAVLRLAREIGPVAEEVLAEVASSLGSDVPSQLRPGVVLGTGAGERVEPALPLAPHAFVVLPQPFPMPTAEVYREADRLALPRDAGALASIARELRAALLAGEELPLSRLILNDLEPAAVSLRPEIGDALVAVRAADADRALVCGSGPTVVGIYEGERGRARAVAAASTLARAYPGACPAIPVSAEFGAPQGE